MTNQGIIKLIYHKITSVCQTETHCDIRALMQKKKILHLINGEFYSGAERVQDLLAQNLPKYGYNVTLACVKPGTFQKRCSCGTENIVEFPMNSRLDIATAISIGRYAKQSGFSLIHSHTARTALVGYIASRVARLPLAHHVHSPTKKDTETWVRNKLNSIVDSAIFNKAAQVIAVSNSLKSYLLDRGVAEEKISVVWNGVPTVHRLEQANTKQFDGTIGTLALFRPRKGIEVLVKAIKILKERGRIVSLRAAGEFETPSYEKEIKNLISKYKIEKFVQWIGFVNDIEEEFNCIDLFVLPSLYGEGLPMVVLEAMANYVPVISTRVEGLPEAIPSSQYGILVAPGDAVQLADAIDNLFSDPEKMQEIKKNAYSRQQEILSEQSMAAGVAAIYDNILK